MDETQLIKAVVHYQQGLERNIRKNDEQKMLHYISKLFKMPVKVEHLEQTGVGRTVNSLRKISGEVGEAAKSLVTKWKSMVLDSDTPNPKIDTNSKHKEPHSSNIKESDKKHKYQSKEKQSSNSSSSSSSKKNYDNAKYSKKEDNAVAISKEKNSKHKYSKFDEESLDSESDSEIKKVKKHSKYRSLKNKHVYDSSDDSELEKPKRDSHSKSSSSKRKNEDEYNKIVKRIRDDDFSNSKKYESSKSNNSDDELISEEEIKKSSKVKNKCKSEFSNEDKIKYSHKHKEKHHHHHKQEKSAMKNNSKHVDKAEKSKEKLKNVKDSKHNSSKSNKEHKPSSKSSAGISENGIGSSSGASFAEALGMLEPSSNKGNKKKVALVQPFQRSKTTTKCGSSSPEMAYKEPAPNLIVKSLTEQKLEPLDINVSSLLPEITPNYRPMGNYMLSNDLIKNKVQHDDALLVEIMNSKISRTKVYSGNKVTYSKVPSLFELCTRILKDNIDALEYTGGVPYDILKPVIERANPDQLFMLEHHNPYLIEDTDQLWEFHCQKEFRTKKREEMETWRDMYMRCLDEREAKLKALTANIKLSQDKSLPVRQTKLAYVDSFVKPPRAVLRKQAKHGTGSDNKPIMTPSSRLAGIAATSAIGHVSVPNPGARAAASSSSSTALKPKKAPLMQKTLAFMKNRHFRR